MTSPRLTIMRHCASLFVLLVGLSASLHAEPLTKHPVIQRMTTEGFSVGDDELVRLTPPLVAPDMPAAEQQAAFAELVGERRVERYLQDSIVAPFELEIKTLRKTEGNGSVRALDMYFVVRGDLEIINQKDLLSGMMDAEPEQEVEESGFETYMDPVGRKPAASDEPPPKGTLVSSLFRYRFPILERVVISGLLQGEALQADGALMQTAISPRDKLNDPEDPTQWQAIPRDAKTDAELGQPQPFRGFVCYLQATQLAFEEDAVLIECHAAYVEPYGWFNGRNILASKLPLAMQQSVRDFRRKLKEAQEKVAASE